MPKVKVLDDIFDWEEAYGTDSIEYFPEYNLNLPYWVAYMPMNQRIQYVNEIRKTRDWEEE